MSLRYSCAQRSSTPVTAVLAIAVAVLSAVLLRAAPAGAGDADPAPGDRGLCPGAIVAQES